MSGVILAIIPTIIPVMLAPVLDYSVSKPLQVGNTPIYISNITITNMGIYATNNVTVSVIANNVTIASIYSEPYLPNNTRSFTSDILNQPGRAIYKVDKLLPHATMTLHMKMDATGFGNAKLITYVQSDETIGYHGILYVILAYLSVAVTLSFISMYIFTANRKWWKWIGVWGPGVFCIIVTSLFLWKSSG